VFNNPCEVKFDASTKDDAHDRRREDGQRNSVTRMSSRALQRVPAKMERRSTATIRALANQFGIGFLETLQDKASSRPQWQHHYCDAGQRRIGP